MQSDWCQIASTMQRLDQEEAEFGCILCTCTVHVLDLYLLVCYRLVLVRV